MHAHTWYWHVAHNKCDMNALIRVCTQIGYRIHSSACTIPHIWYLHTYVHTFFFFMWYMCVYIHTYIHIHICLNEAHMLVLSIHTNTCIKTNSTKISHLVCAYKAQGTLQFPPPFHHVCSHSACSLLRYLLTTSIQHCFHLFPFQSALAEWCPIPTCVNLVFVVQVIHFGPRLRSLFF